MNYDTLQPNTPPTTTPPVQTPPVENSSQNSPSTGGLDPSVQALAESIQQQESGGDYTASGDNGSASGAYQWDNDVNGKAIPLQKGQIPSNFQTEAKQFGLDPDDFSPVNQNHVAYEQINDWKNKGFTPPQITSMWNTGAGAPNAYQTNPKVAQYASNVQKNYNAILSGQPMTTGKNGATDTSADTQGMSTLEKIALGIGGIGAVGAGIAFAPEIAAGGTALAGLGESAIDAASSIPLVGKFIPGIAADLGITGAINTVKGVLGGNKSSSTDAQNEEQATEDAGQTEANATNNASQTNVESEESIADEQQTQQQIKDAQNITQATNNSVAQTPTGKVLISSPVFQQGTQTMGTNNYIPDTSEGVDNYGYKSNSGAFKKSMNDVKDISTGTEQILGMEGGRGDVESTRQKAYKRIESTMAQPQWEEAKANVDEVINSGNKDFGNGDGSMNLDKMERLKRDYGQLAGKWDATLPTAKRGAYKALNRAFRDEISNKTKHKDLYNRAMKAEQNIFDAQKVMKHREGKKSLEHKGLVRGILKSYSKYVGTAIGDKIGGVFGAVVGTMVGDHLTKAVDKRFGKTYFESKEGKKLIELASKKSPAMAKVLKKELQKYGVKAEAMKKEAEERIKKGHLLSSGAIPMGAKTSKDEIKVLQANKNPVSTNPKSGKFQTSYNSSGVLPKKDLSKKLEGLFGGNVSQRKPKKKK